jgi:hypothetical protein
MNIEISDDVTKRLVNYTVTLYLAFLFHILKVPSTIYAYEVVRGFPIHSREILGA